MVTESEGGNSPALRGELLFVCHISAGCKAENEVGVMMEQLPREIIPSPFALVFQRVCI